MEERHKRLLVKQNPHWDKGRFTVPAFKRDMYAPLTKYIDYKQIVALVGLRRIGKTVLLKQLINHLSDQVGRRNICYISFDDRDFQKYEIAEELILYFLEFSEKDERRYLFLDEIQKVPNWNDLLKSLYDTEENMKMIVSGSSSLELKKGKETLAGRLLTLTLPVFSFRELLRYKGLEHTIDPNRLLKEYDLKFLPAKERYQELFSIYLTRGAFPELLDIDDEDFIKRYIRESVIDKVVADLSKQIEPEREDIVHELLRIFSQNTANLFEIATLTNALGVNRNIVSRYVRLLEKSFLIRISYNCTKSVIKQTRVSKKAYIAHPSITLSLLDYPLDLVRIEGSDTGRLVESVIVNHLEKSSFWRSPQKDEVDIVIRQGEETIPIEVKYRGQIAKRDLRSLVKFMRKSNVEKALVVTKDMLKEEGPLLYIPAWLFLLLERDALPGHSSTSK